MKMLLEDLVECYPWVENLYQEKTRDGARLNLSDYYANLSKLVYTGPVLFSPLNKDPADTDVLNSILEYLPIDCDTLILVGLLRFTFLKKEDLPAWHSLLKKTEDELVKRGEDPKTLRGLKG